MSPDTTQYLFSIIWFVIALDRTWDAMWPPKGSPAGRAFSAWSFVVGSLLFTWWFVP